MEDFAKAPGSGPVDPVLEAKLARVAEEWREETSIITVEQGHPSELWQHQVEDPIRPIIWLTVPFRLFDLGRICSGCESAAIGLACSGLIVWRGKVACHLV